MLEQPPHVVINIIQQSVHDKSLKVLAIGLALLVAPTQSPLENPKQRHRVFAVVVQNPRFLGITNLAHNSNPALLLEGSSAIEPLSPVLDGVLRLVEKNGSILGRVAEVPNSVKTMVFNLE